MRAIVIDIGVLYAGYPEGRTVRLARASVVGLGAYGKALDIVDRSTPIKTLLEDACLDRSISRSGRSSRTLAFLL